MKLPVAVEAQLGHDVGREGGSTIRLTRFTTTYILVALAIAALSLALGLQASNPQGAHAGVAASAASPTPTATPAPIETAPATDAPAPLQVNAGMAEYRVTSDPTGVPTGSVQLNVTNTGALAHEFVIMQTDNPPNALLYDDTTQKALEDAPGQQDVGEVGGELPFILPGKPDSGAFDLEPGRYVLLCNIPGHYKAGMYTSFTVGSVSPATNVPTATPSPSVAAAPSPTVAPTPANAPSSQSVVHGVAIVGGLSLVFAMMIACMIMFGFMLRDA